MLATNFVAPKRRLNNDKGSVLMSIMAWKFVRCGDFYENGENEAWRETHVEKVISKRVLLQVDGEHN